MTKSERSPKSGWRTALARAEGMFSSLFAIRHSFVIRHWSVVIVGLLLLLSLLARAENAPRSKGRSPEDLENSIQRGVAFLLKDQNQNGSWGTAQRTKDLNIFAPVPGAHHAFRSGVTALGVAALI